MFENQELERRKLNDHILNQLNELNQEVRELRKENADQFRYITDTIGKCSNDSTDKFVLTGTFWKVASTLFVLVCGSYSYIAVLHHIKV